MGSHCGINVSATTHVAIRHSLAHLHRSLRSRARSFARSLARGKVAKVRTTPMRRYRQTHPTAHSPSIYDRKLLAILLKKNPSSSYFTIVSCSVCRLLSDGSLFPALMISDSFFAVFLLFLFLYHESLVTRLFYISCSC